MVDANTIITVGAIVFGFAGQTLYFRGVFSAKIKDHERRIEHTEGCLEKKADKESLSNLQRVVQFSNTCEALSGGLRDRVVALECVRNGKK